MHRLASITFFTFGLIAPIFAQTAPNNIIAIPPVPRAALVWDATSKEYSAKQGEMSAPFSFIFTNISSSEVVINSANTSCGCTVAQLPMQPWPIAPGATGEIKAAMNLAGKMGRVTKQITIKSSAGDQALMVNVIVPTPEPPSSAENKRGDRNANIEKAKADRQLVFKGDCRSCHVDPGVGKFGKDLFVAGCAICHDTPLRAAMVPDLRAPKSPRDDAYWSNWITHGREGSLMPAFGEKHGGPLSKEQIDSLVSYLMENFPKGPVTPTPAIAPLPPTLPIPSPKTGAGQ